jgi:hypothetical protein
MFAPFVDAAALMKCAGTGIFEFRMSFSGNCRDGRAKPMTECRTSYPFSTPFPPTSNPTCDAQILIRFETERLALI